MLSLVPEQLPIESDEGVTYSTLLEACGIEEEPVMQVKASPDGEWCKPAVGRAVTSCGLQLGAYALRDESYLGRLCTRGCFSPYELSTLAPAARKADEDAKREKEREGLDRWYEENDRRRELADELRARRESARQFPPAVPRKSDVEDE